MSAGMVVDKVQTKIAQANHKGGVRRLGEAFGGWFPIEGEGGLKQRQRPHDPPARRTEEKAARAEHHRRARLARKKRQRRQRRAAHAA